MPPAPAAAKGGKSGRGRSIAPTKIPKPPARIVPGTRGRQIRVAGKAGSDPRFLKVMTAIEASSVKVKSHPTAATKAYQAQSAAKAAPKEQIAGAQAGKVDELKDAKTEKPKDNSFLAMLRGEIEKVMPKTNDDAGKFMEGGQKDQIKGAVTGNVNQQKDQATGPLKASSETPPDPSGVPAKEEEPIPADPASPAPPVNTGEAMPTPAPTETIQANANEAKQSADQQMKDAEITDTQMQKANDPRFSAVVSKKDNVAKVATAGVNNYKAGEAKVLTQAIAQSQDAGKQGLMQFTLTKGRGNNAVRAKQEAAKARDEARRKEVTTNIENIFNKTKTKVDSLLNGLEAEVTGLFDSGSEAALTKMKSTSEREITKFKLKRYLGFGGPALWAIDQFRETRPEINEILERNRVVFTADMDAMVVKIANVVEQRLAQAKAEIDRGQASIKAYVDSLPRDLQAVGQAAQQETQARFDELRQGVDAKKEQLAQKLAERYKAAQDGANAEVKKMQDANKGALSGLVAAIGEVIKMLTEFKNKLMALIRKGQETIKIIVADPIAFLKNLLAAIKGGLNKFISNILTHLKNAFMQWLFGSLAEAGIEIPKDLSLPSILKLVLGVLGITYERMRAKAVKLIGERNVKIIEKLVEYVKALIDGGPAALWEKVKEDLSTLKQMVIDALQNWLIETLVKKAIAKIVSMFNPVGAIIQAILTIYDVVIFVVEKAKQIMAFVEAIINSVHSIATGAIGGAIDWIEKSLARILPLLIGFLAQFIGLGGISKKIKEFIQKIQDKVDKAIDKAIAKIVDVVKKLFGKGSKDGKDDEKQLKLDQAMVAAKSASTKFSGKRVGAAVLKPLFAVIKLRYGLKKLEPVQEGDKWIIVGEINPTAKADSGVKAVGQEGDQLIKAAQGIEKTLESAVENGRRAQKAGDDRQKARIVELQAKAKTGAGTFIPTTDKSQGIDAGFLSKEADDDVLDLIEIKKGRSPRTVKTRASSRNQPPVGADGKPKIPINVPNGRGQAARMIIDNPEVASQVASGKAALMKNGVQVQNQLSGITENLKQNIQLMVLTIQKAVATNALTPEDQSRVNKIITGQGGTLRFVIDIEKGAKMSPDQWEAAQILIKAAFDNLKKDFADWKTKLEIKINKS